jgi:enoyl-[acyl-carrier protein] reductase II
MIQGWKKDPSIVDVLHDTGVSHVFTSAGDPALFTERLHEAGMTVVYVVGSLRAAQKALDAGVDALVVEGVEGGGFKSALGASTMVLLPLVAERVDRTAQLRHVVTVEQCRPRARAKYRDSALPSDDD